eukprot:TRINITY_DN4874_c0_g1_i1.p1 TRINITY_DN4874_c0_g1~~TRINITY_DN4874_c0_g1_i1.p1  ORF type:complete len:153 (-),score=22.62 TRINITY_DN4874_c0_g1_i1:244-702(-)
MNQEDIKVARRQIRKRIQKSVAKEKELYPVKIEVGDYVRVQMTIAEKIKKNIFRKKFKRQWSYLIFKVIRISRPSKHRNQVYTLVFEDGQSINRRFYRHEIQKIDKTRLLRKQINTIAEASRTLQHDPKDMFDFYYEVQERRKRIHLVMCGN